MTGAPLGPVLVLSASLLALLALAGLVLRRLRELERARAAFVAAISHDLRTPLAQIQLFAELLQDERMRSDEERIRWARGIDREAGRLAHLVESVLSFSRVERGDYRLERERFDLAAELDEASRAFAPVASARHARIRVSAPAGLTAYADRAAVRTMLLCLLDNAVKFGPRSQTIEVGATGTAESAVVWVDDEGPGIPEGERDRVWRPFTRLARAAERASGGGGLGLALVRRLAELHGGEVWIERAPGGGARVGFRLPLPGAGGR